MTEFAAALNKQHWDEMKAAYVTGRVDALEKRMAKLEARLASLKEPFVAIPAAPATNPDPTA